MKMFKLGESYNYTEIKQRARQSDLIINKDARNGSNKGDLKTMFQEKPKLMPVHKAVATDGEKTYHFEGIINAMICVKVDKDSYDFSKCPVTLSTITEFNEYKSIQ